MPLPLKYFREYLQGVPAYNYATRGCLSPSKLWVTDATTGEKMHIVVDCGKCVNCRNQRRNEWVTRMWLHSLDLNDQPGLTHCYFVTLTYGSYNLHPFKKHPFLIEWLRTYPSYDTLNYRHKLSWTPSILYHPHLTKFIKRLRVLVPSEISYCACGEYGSSADGTGYGRPHFHLIVWSKTAISPAQFQQAWSYQCVRTGNKYVINKATYNSDPKQTFQFNIGRVYVDDLVASGALDKDKEYNPATTSGSSCFSYVAKYVGKLDDNIPMAAQTRLKAVFADLPIDDQGIINDRSSNLCYHESLDGDMYFFDLTPSSCRILSDPEHGVYFVDECQQYKLFNYKSKTYDKLDYRTFEKIVAPFFVTSRTYAIGKHYALQNLNRFAQKNYSLPKVQGRQLTFPRYYSRLVSLQKYPLRVTSTATNKSLIKYNLPSLYEYYTALHQNPNEWFLIALRLKNSPEFRQFITNPIALTQDPIQSFIYDVTICSPLNGNIHYLYFPHLQQFRGFIYDKHTKEYTEVDVCERIDFCDYVLRLLDAQFMQAPYKKQQNDQQNTLFDAIESDPHTPTLRQQHIDNCTIRQERYKAGHKLKSDNQ